MNTYYTFELSTATSFFTAPGKSSHRRLMDGFKNTPRLAEDDDTSKADDADSGGEGDRDIPGEKPDTGTVKPK